MFATLKGQKYFRTKIFPVKQFVNDLRQVGYFSPNTPLSSTNKTDRHDIAKILLKVALNTITLILSVQVYMHRKPCKVPKEDKHICFTITNVCGQ